MNPDRWQQISQVYHAALTRHARERAAFLREACAGDPALQQEVESLLSSENKAAGFLSEPAFAAAAGIVNHPGTMLTGRRIGAWAALQAAVRRVARRPAIPAQRAARRRDRFIDHCRPGLDGRSQEVGACSAVAPVSALPAPALQRFICL